VYAGLLAWLYFTSATTNGALSLLTNGGIIAKTYFPRLYAPLAVVAAPLVDLFLAFVVLLGLFAYFGRAPSWQIVFLPLFILVELLLSLGVGLYLAGPSVRYRDLGFGLPFVLQVLLYATPVIYPSSLVPGRYQWLLSLNPMTSVIEGFRWCLFDTAFPSASALAGGIGISSFLAVTGLFVFRRSERTVVDLF
jgi:lipopolysaccharide transport system permease protein